MYTIATTEQLATFIKAYRKSRRMSQTELGRRLGVSKARVSVIESEPGRIGVALLLRVLNALEVQLSLDDAKRVRTSATGTVRTGEW